MDAEYKFIPGAFQVTDQIKKDFDEFGYILVRGIFDDNELSKLKTALEHDDGIKQKAFMLSDGEEKNTKICIWNHPGKDITGMVARSEKIATTTEKLLGDEVYHYHTKLMMKEAGGSSGSGKFNWHQDYGYWYHNGCLFPDMATVFIAIDPALKTNGGLQIIPKSHQCGRLEHAKVGDQMRADHDRVEHLQKQFGVVNVEMQPGDALFFHCNLLHCSTKNLSDMRRWAFLIAYNTKTNNPVIKHHCPRYTPLEKVPDTAILQCSTTTDLTGKGFFKHVDSPSGKWEFQIEDDHLN